MDYSTLQLVGRILFGGYFAMMGLMHFMKMNDMKKYAQMKRVASPGAAVTLSGLMLLAGGLSVLFQYEMMYGLWLLVIFLVPTAFLMHNFWKESDPKMKMVEMSQFMKNMALAGAALMML